MTEHEIQQRILLACSRGDTRLFRNNVGTGWAGQATRVTAGNLRAVLGSIRPGDVLIRQGRPLHAGLCVGSSDLIGYRSLEVSPAMIGQRVAQFAALEIKSATGRPTAEQAQFLATIRQAGGCSGITRNQADADLILRGAY